MVYRQGLPINNIRSIIISSITVRNMSSFTSLHGVLDKGSWNSEDIKKFLEYDSSSVNEVNSSGDTPLTRVLANDKCSVDVVKLLLNYGSDVNCSSRGHWKTPLIIALMTNRNVDFINLLLEKGARINVYGPSGISPICLAFHFFTSKDVIRLLLDAGCLPFGCTWHGTAFHCAIEHIRKRPLDECVLQLFIEKRADVNAVNLFGQSVLCFALKIGLQASSIKVLLAAGSVLNCTNHTNPLFCAIRCMGTELKADVVQLLLEQGACVDIKVLQCAIKKCLNETKAIELLLDHYQGVDAKDVKDELNNTLLHLAVENPCVKQSLVKLLVKRGVAVNTVNKNGDTALHKFAMHSYTLSRVVKTLLKSGSRVNLENSSGETALHLAMKRAQKTDTLKMLLAAGARIGVTGYSLLKGAIEHCNSSVANNSYGYFEHKRKLDCCKLLVKGYFLENSNFDFQNMIQGHHEYEELSRFGIDCVRELQKLDSKVISQGRTLRDFLSECSPFQVDAANCEIEAKSVLFHRLLRIIAENAFPLFLDIISAKVGRSSMKIKLQKLQVYTYLSDESRMGKKVVLNYDTVHKIAYLLTDDDLLSFTSAFYKTDDHSYAGKVSKENINEDKRSGEQSQQHHKRPRLHL